MSQFKTLNLNLDNKMNDQKDKKLVLVAGGRL